MNLKKIEMYGFKSFADKIELKFEDGVTAIVGPNGCGKSNVADAVRWVLGEQSAKTLRGKSMSDLIFSGTELRKSLSYCEVSLHFDNSDKTVESVPYSEIVISRKLYKTGESEYLINRQVKRLKDITDLLYDSGMGREGFSIIGQGKIDEILSAKPDDRRGIFEEATGTSKFRQRKTETERKLARTRDNLVTHVAVLTELERQLSPLKKQAEDAKKYLEIKEKLKLHEVNIFLQQFDNAAAVKGDIQRKLHAIRDELTLTEALFTEAESNYKNSVASIENADKVINELREEQLELTVGIEKQTGEIRLNKERISYLEEQNRRLKRNIDDYTKEQATLTAELSTKLDAQKNTKSKLEELKAEHEELFQSHLDIVEIINSNQNEIENSQREIIESLDKMSDLKSVSAKLTAELAGLRERLKESEQKSTDYELFMRAVKNLLKDDTLNDPKVKKIFAALLGNTVVVNGDEFAINIVKKYMPRFKIVTEDAIQTTDTSQINARIEEINKQKNSTEMLSESISSERENSGDNIKSIQEEYEQNKKERDKIYEKMTENKVAQARLITSLTALENDVTRTQKEIKDLAYAREDAVERLEANFEQIAEAERKTFDGSSIEEKKLLEIKNKLSNLDEFKNALMTTRNQADTKRTELNFEIIKISDKKYKEESNLARVDTDLEIYEERIAEEYNLNYETAQIYRQEGYEVKKGSTEVNKLKREILALGYVNVNAIEDYRTTAEIFEEKRIQKEDLEKAEKDLQKIIADLSKEIEIRFNTGFEEINTNFKRIFKELFGGGRANLVLEQVEDGEDPLTAGIDIQAEPPGKKLQSISLLSGGERAMTAIAILFSILNLRPMPFCVLDEIEAALDDSNVIRFARYLQRFSTETQFVIITHKKATMEHADALYGVTMEEKGVSKLVSVKLAEAKALSDQEQAN